MVGRCTEALLSPTLDEMRCKWMHDRIATMDSMIAADYLRDLGLLLRRGAFEAKEEADAAKGSSDQDYKAGRLFAYYEVISLMQQQAEAFGLSLAAVSLEGVNPESDLL